MSTRALLKTGAIAGPLYIALGIAQIVTRDGFDMRRHALSLLANGEYGWVQVANFLVCGVLVAIGAVGVRRLLHPGRAGTWGPILLIGYTIGLIGAGIFKADPGLGFPPGTPLESYTMTQSGMLHFVFGGIGFYSLIAACFVFARRAFERGERGWGMYSIVTGIGFLISFGAIASGNMSASVILAFYAAVAWIWVWHCWLMVRLAEEN